MNERLAAGKEKALRDYESGQLLTGDRARNRARVGRTQMLEPAKISPFERYPAKAWATRSKKCNSIRNVVGDEDSE